jgi:hypothetical protein
MVWVDPVMSMRNLSQSTIVRRIYLSSPEEVYLKEVVKKLERTSPVRNDVDVSASGPGNCSDAFAWSSHATLALILLNFHPVARMLELCVR